jgi:thiol-disulfide isomerase/thioredoxin
VIGPSIFTFISAYKRIEITLNYKQQHSKTKTIMRSIYIFASILASAISANRVIHLDSDNFDMVVDGTRNVFLKFEAEWCGPCKRVAPIMDQVAREQFPDIDGETILAAIDADKEREIGERFDIEGFPTMKLFLKGRAHEDAIEFSGERSPANIANFINHHVNQNNLSLNGTQTASPSFPLSKILAETAKVGPKPRQNLQVNSYQDFHSGALEKSHTPSPSHDLKQHKQKKSKTKKNKTKSKHTAIKTTELREVSASEAMEIVKNAGSKPVVLIFFSPSTKSNIIS